MWSLRQTPDSTRCLLLWSGLLALGWLTAACSDGSGSSEPLDSGVDLTDAGAATSAEATGFAAALGVQSYTIVDRTDVVPVVTLTDGDVELGRLQIDTDTGVWALGGADEEATLFAESFNDPEAGTTRIQRTFTWGGRQLRIDAVLDESDDVSSVVWSTPTSQDVPEAIILGPEGEGEAAFLLVSDGERVGLEPAAALWIEAHELEGLLSSAAVARLAAATADPSLQQLFVDTYEVTASAGTQPLHLSGACTWLRERIETTDSDACRACARENESGQPVEGLTGAMTWSEWGSCGICLWRASLQIPTVVRCMRTWRNPDDHWGNDRCALEAGNARPGHIWQANADGHGCHQEFELATCQRYCNDNHDYDVSAKNASGSCRCEPADATVACQARGSEDPLCYGYLDSDGALVCETNTCRDGIPASSCELPSDEACDPRSDEDVCGRGFRCARDCSDCEPCDCLSGDDCEPDELCLADCRCHPAMSCADSFFDFLVANALGEPWCDPAASQSWCGAERVCDPLSCRCRRTGECNNFEHDDGEECDATATPTGCGQGFRCNNECSCEPDPDAGVCCGIGCTLCYADSNASGGTDRLHYVCDETIEADSSGSDWASCDPEGAPSQTCYLAATYECCGDGDVTGGPCGHGECLCCTERTTGEQIWTCESRCTGRYDACQ